MSILGAFLYYLSIFSIFEQAMNIVPKMLVIFGDTKMLVIFVDTKHCPKNACHFWGH